MLKIFILYIYNIRFWLERGKNLNRNFKSIFISPSRFERYIAMLHQIWAGKRILFSGPFAFQCLNCHATFVVRSVISMQISTEKGLIFKIRKWDTHHMCTGNKMKFLLIEMQTLFDSGKYLFVFWNKGDNICFDEYYSI